MKRFVALLVTLCLVLSLGFMPASAEEGRLEGSPWVNSNLYGRWPSERPAPEEQFELYANFDNYRAVLERGDNADSTQITRADKTTEENLLALCTDSDRTDAECESLRILYGFLTDRESIADGGFASLMTYVDRVKSVKTVDELTALMQEEGFLFCRPFFSCEINYPSVNGDGKYLIDTYRSYEIGETSLSDEESEANPMAEPAKDTEGAARKLIRMGYGEAEASELVKRIAWFEGEYVNEYIDSLPADREGIDSVLSAEQLRASYPPLYAMLKGKGFVREGHEAEAVFSISSDEFGAVCHLYTEENLELFKAIIALSFYNAAMPYLGSAVFPEYDEDLPGIRKQLDYCCRPLLTQAYQHTYIPEERLKVSVQLFEEIKEVLRARIEQSTWASDRTKKNALQKVDQMRHNDLTYRWEIDFEPLRSGLRGCSCLLEAAAQCILFNNQCTATYAGQESHLGDRYIETFNQLSGDGQYNPHSNGFSIGFGALNGDMYDDTSRETLLATLGSVLAHESSHGFDNFGMNFDAYGQENPLWSETDRQLYMERANAIADRAAKIKLLDDMNVKGRQQLPEIIADMQGMRLLLDLAQKEADFDYDVFFRRYAQWDLAWFMDRTEYSDYYFTSLHPSEYVRVNFTVQSMDEFYATYPSVTEGTPMYLAPEERLFVW